MICPTPSFSPARGFTLIEILAVLVLAGLLSAVVCVSLAHSHRQSTLQDAVDGVAFQDALFREHVRRTGEPERLAFHLDEGWIGPEVREDRRETLNRYLLPEGYRISRLLLPGAELTQGREAVSCSGAGRTPSYAVLIAGPAEQRQWLLVVGPTGLTRKVDDERSVYKVFEELSR